MKAAYHDFRGNRNMLGLHGKASQYPWSWSGGFRRAKIGRPGESVEIFFGGARNSVPGSNRFSGRRVGVGEQRSGVGHSTEDGSRGRDPPSTRACARAMVGACDSPASGASRDRAGHRAWRVLAQGNNGRGERQDGLSAGERSARRSTSTGWKAAKSALAGSGATDPRRREGGIVLSASASEARHLAQYKKGGDPRRCRGRPLLGGRERRRLPPAASAREGGRSRRAADQAAAPKTMSGRLVQTAERSSPSAR